MLQTVQLAGTCFEAPPEATPLLDISLFLSSEFAESSEFYKREEEIVSPSDLLKAFM